MADLKERLLPPRHVSAANLREMSNRPSASGRQPFNGVDVMGLKKHGQGLWSWIRVDASGNSQIIEVDKFTMMRRCDLPARDLRLLDPLFVYPSMILGREKALVVNLEQIRCIITADEGLLLNSLDSYVLQYVVELQRHLTSAGTGDVWPPGGAHLPLARGENFIMLLRAHHLIICRLSLERSKFLWRLLAHILTPRSVERVIEVMDYTRLLH